MAELRISITGVRLPRVPRWVTCLLAVTAFIVVTVCCLWAMAI